MAKHRAFTLEDVRRAIEVLERNSVPPKPDGTYDLFAGRVRVREFDPAPGLGRFGFIIGAPDVERMNREMALYQLERSFKDDDT